MLDGSEPTVFSLQFYDSGDFRVVAQFSHNFLEEKNYKKRSQYRRSVYN